MAGKESRSKGSGRGLKGKTGVSGDNGRGVRGDEYGGGASPDTGVGVARNLGRFGGRTSRSGSRGTRSAAISEGEMDGSEPARARQARRHWYRGAIDFGSSRATQLCLPVRDRSRRCAQETTPNLSRRRPLLEMKKIPSSSRAET